MYDAECDLAAVAFGAGDDPDSLLIDFARHLGRSGFRPIGVIQLGHASEADTLRAVLFPGDEVVSVAHDTGHDSFGCRIDSRWLTQVAAQIEDAIAAGADLVIINRFGKLEADGHGLIDLVRKAADADIPVLIAVPEHRFAAWIRHSGGMNVRLPCRRSALDRWWRLVRRGAAAQGAAETFCEIAK
jgi:Protein of unknown function (DUF2478)